MPTFLTVKEAATLTGKSPSSIRRIIYPILETPKHPDRHHIEPNEKQTKALRVEGENFAWRISEELLHRQRPTHQTKSSGFAKSPTASGDKGSAAVVVMLQRELEIKNKQIETQNELLKELSQRIREGNILMGSLQQQLALTGGSSRAAKAVDAATTESAQKGSGATTGSKKKTHWLFKKIF